MRIFRRVLVSTLALAALLVATPTFAQTPPPQGNEQGLGVFLQGGFTWSKLYGSGSDTIPTDLSDSSTGVVFGVAFGGNKSGWFGIGADINYMIRNVDTARLIGIDVPGGVIQGALKTHYLDIPVYGRVNFMGHQTKGAPTAYVIFGGFVDIMLKGQIDGIDVKDQFNGFDVGPLFGAGFEVARVGFEFRGNWSVRSLNSTGNGTFLNGLEKSNQFTLLLLFRVRLN